MDLITITVIILISAVALAEIIKIFLKLPSPESAYGFTAVIVLNTDDDVEMKMENILHKIKWTDNELIHRIIVVNNGMDDEQIEICRQYCRENHFLEITEPDETLNLIISGEKNNAN